MPSSFKAYGAWTNEREFLRCCMHCTPIWHCFCCRSLTTYVHRLQKSPLFTYQTTKLPPDLMRTLNFPPNPIFSFTIKYDIHFDPKSVHCALWVGLLKCEPYFIGLTFYIFVIYYETLLYYELWCLSWRSRSPRHKKKKKFTLPLNLIFRILQILTSKLVKYI